MEPVQALLHQPSAANQLVRRDSPPIWETRSELTPDEKQIVEVKYKSKRIELLTDTELSKWTKALLLKIHVITGWVISADNALYNVLIDQFQKQLSEKYFELNPDEIEFAFRSYGTQTEDWGKEMNLNLIDKILIAYLQERYKVSTLEEQLASKKQGQEFNLKTSVNWRAQIENNYQHFICGSRYFTKDMHPLEYEQLEQDGFIEKDAFRTRLKMYQQRLLMEDKKMADLAKARTVLQLFRMAAKARYKNLYVR